MAGYYVFPGGVIDPADWKIDIWKDHIDLDGSAIRRRLGGDNIFGEDIAYGVAAVRETFEESGVFLARKRKIINAADELAAAQAFRHSAGDRPGWLTEYVKSENWLLMFSALYRWSRWITPVGMKKRYDTRFFIAVMPDGQRCCPDERETTHGLWVSPEDGLMRNMAGKIPLSPPTVVTLHQLLNYENVSVLIKQAAKRPWGEPIRPRLKSLENSSMIIEPWDHEYDQKNITVRTDELEQMILPVGEPFSRIWHHEGLWQPVHA